VYLLHKTICLNTFRNLQADRIYWTRFWTFLHRQPYGTRTTSI